MKTNWRQTAPRTLADAVRGPDYGSPYCPGESDTSDPWFVQHSRVMDVALVLACVAAVAAAAMAIFMWGLA